MININFIKNKFFTSHYLNNFCILLTASVDPNGCNFLKRSDIKTREKDYLDSLKLWLTKTKFKIVFCENSVYDLKNIRDLCDLYPGRVEIIQFNGNNYPRHLGKGYGEFKIIEKAMNDSVFIKHSENIIKVTGRIFIENIDNLVLNYPNDSIVGFSKEFVPYLSYRQIQTIVFIFKKQFIEYFKIKSHTMDDSKGIYFEKVFEETVSLIKKKGFKFYFFKKVKYMGISGTTNIKYMKIFKFNIINIGKIGKHLKSKTPFIYKILKPYFPDKQ